MCTAFKNASEENEPNQHGTCSVQLLHHLPGTGDLALLIAFFAKLTCTDLFIQQ